MSRLQSRDREGAVFCQGVFSATERREMILVVPGVGLVLPPLTENT
jgi:hypothetical protein